MTPVELPPENVSNMQLYSMLRDMRHLQVRQAERMDEFSQEFKAHREKVEPVLEWFDGAKLGAKVILFLAAIGLPVGAALGYFFGERS